MANRNLTEIEQGQEPGWTEKCHKTLANICHIRTGASGKTFVHSQITPSSSRLPSVTAHSPANGWHNQIPDIVCNPNCCFWRWCVRCTFSCSLHLVITSSWPCQTNKSNRWVAARYNKTMISISLTSSVNILKDSTIVLPKQKYHCFNEDLRRIQICNILISIIFAFPQ